MATYWTRVGAVITEHMDEIGMQQKDLAALSNVSSATIREIQGGKARRRNPRILQAISVAFGWPGNYLEDILHGRQPVPQSHEEREEVPADGREGPSVVEPSAFLAKLAFVLEHRIGQIVDVIYNNDSDVDITIEIRHSPREQ